jgi:prolyl-tRNA synthetase
MEVEMADDQQVFDITGVPTGYLGPIGLRIKVVADETVAGMRNFAIGANEKNYHLLNANLGRDFEVAETADLRLATADDRCCECGGVLELTRGIEVGHIFKLGDSYSRAMNATFQDSGGEKRYFVMGCYGIGVSRIVAAAIEQNHDDNGIVFPLPIAPFQVIVLNLGLNNEEITEAATGIYDGLRSRGVDVLFDDRDERPGVKFKDADLIGIPFRLTIGKRFMKEGLVEIRRRSDGQILTLPPDKAVEELIALIRTELDNLC